MRIYYLNSIGKRIDLDRYPCKMLADMELFNYEWDYSTQNINQNKVRKFYKKLSEKEFQIAIVGGNSKDHAAVKEELLKTFDYDVASQTAGRLYIGEYFIECFIIKSQKYDWNRKVSHLECSILCENPVWRKEEKYSFGGATNPAYSTDGLEYPYDFTYDFAGLGESCFISNEGYTGADFEFVIYGACENPVISIGFQTYAVYTTLETGEYIIINSVMKKIYKVKNNGERVNLFHLRDKTFDIFKKIPPGISAAAWSGAFGFDLTLYIERSEPPWI